MDAAATRMGKCGYPSKSNACPAECQTSFCGFYRFFPALAGLAQNQVAHDSRGRNNAKIGIGQR
jgi:hypothetical protein